MELDTPLEKQYSAPCDVNVIQNLDYTKPVDEQVKYMSERNPSNERLNLCNEGDDVLAKTKLDLYLPTPSQKNNNTESNSTPVTVFVHGGGWKRGHKQGWDHFLSRWDTNFLMYAVHKWFNVYDNIGESLSRRGIACAVITYPLSRLSLPWCFLEIFTSFLCTVLGLGVFILPSILTVDLCVDGLTKYVRSPLGVYLISTVGMTQVITLATIVYRRRYYGISKFQAISLALSFITMTYIQAMLIVIFNRRAIEFVYSSSISTTILVQCFLTWLFLELPTASYTDQLDAVNQSIRWVKSMGQRTGIYDPDLLFLMGHSAGGHLATMATVNNIQKNSLGLKGLISISGVYDVAKLASGILTSLYVNPAFGFDKTHWENSSPIHRFRRWLKSATEEEIVEAPSIFLINAKLDYPLHSHADRLYMVLKEGGMKVTKMIVDWTDHFTVTATFGKTEMEERCANFIWNLVKKRCIKTSPVP